MNISLRDKPAGSDPYGLMLPVGKLVEAFSHLAPDYATMTALEYHYLAGDVTFDNVVVSVAAGHVHLADDDVSYVEVDDAGTVSANITEFTSGKRPLAEVTTASGAITVITDKRTWLSGGAGGGGGGAIPDPATADQTPFSTGAGTVVWGQLVFDEWGHVVIDDDGVPAWVEE